MIIYPSVNAAEKKMWVWCYGILKGKRKSVFFFIFFFMFCKIWKQKQILIVEKQNLEKKVIGTSDLKNWKQLWPEDAPSDFQEG